MHSSFMPSARLGIYARLGDQSALDGLKFISYGLEWTRGEPESTVDTAVRAIKRKVKVVSGKTGSIRDASTPVDHDRLLEENNISQRSLSESADKEVKTLLLGPLAWVNVSSRSLALATLIHTVRLRSLFFTHDRSRWRYPGMVQHPDRTIHRRLWQKLNAQRYHTGSRHRRITMGLRD